MKYKVIKNWPSGPDVGTEGQMFKEKDLLIFKPTDGTTGEWFIQTHHISEFFKEKLNLIEHYKALGITESNREYLDMCEDIDYIITAFRDNLDI